MSRNVRKFTELVALLSRGKFETKVDEHLTDAVRTLEELPSEKGKATLTVTLDLVYENGVVDVRPAVKSKLPEEKGFSGTIFWTTPEGDLSVQHPNQTDMFAGPRAAERDEPPRARAGD